MCSNCVRRISSQIQELEDLKFFFEKKKKKLTREILRHSLFLEMQEPIECCRTSKLRFKHPVKIDSANESVNRLKMEEELTDLREQRRECILALKKVEKELSDQIPRCAFQATIIRMFGE